MMIIKFHKIIDPTYLRTYLSPEELGISIDEYLVQMALGLIPKRPTGPKFYMPETRKDWARITPNGKTQ